VCTDRALPSQVAYTNNETTQSFSNSCKDSDKPIFSSSSMLQAHLKEISTSQYSFYSKFQHSMKKRFANKNIKINLTLYQKAISKTKVLVFGETSIPSN